MSIAVDIVEGNARRIDNRIELISEQRSFDPSENLRRELTYMHLQSTAARVWRNTDCVVLGKFLNADEEVYLERAIELGVPVKRRSSGGGAVFNDLGNINYSIYTSDDSPGVRRVDESLRLLSFPVTRLLDNLHVPWTWVPPNNVYVLGRKISGSAQARSRGRIVHHGTLLVRSDLAKMNYLLKPGGRSNRAPVMNLCEVHKGIKVEDMEKVLASIISLYQT